MKWPKWSIRTGGETYDPLPFLIGCLLMLMSVPALLMLILRPDRNAGVLAVPLFVLLAIGAIIGFLFFGYGLRIMASPGSWLYRITHGRIFTR